MQTLARACLGRKLQGRGVDKVLLHQGDEPEQVMRERLGAANAIERAEQCRVDIREHGAHHDPFLKAVEQQALAVRRVVTQDSCAEAVERRDPCFAVIVVQAFVDPTRDLPRGSRREREHQDLIAAGHAFAHGLLVEIDQRVGLSRARPGQHAKRSFYFMDVEWHGVSQGGAGALIMPVRVSWIQPRLLRATTPRPPRPPKVRSRATATA